MMKRKALQILIMIMLFPVALNAASVVISAYTGAYGINMASEKYSGASDNRSEDYGWGRHDGENPTTTPPTFDKFTYDDGLRYYLDEMIIGSGGVKFDLDQKGYKGYRYEIQATCPNGFYFRSQSNPNFVRPFKILIITRFRKEVVENRQTKDVDYTGDVIVLEDTGETRSVYYDQDATADRMWFDMVLALPIDPSEKPVDGTNYIVSDDGQRYSLVQADDYTALVTITIRAFNADGALIGIDSVTIPFSGYYDGITDGKKDARMSLMFTASGSAANLNLKMDAGSRRHIGTIDFLMDAYLPDSSNEPWEEGYIDFTDDYVKIFLSSSSNPSDANASEFRFVHESVQPNTILTNYNSIGFDVIVDGNESTGMYSRYFDGTDHLDSRGEIENAIIPSKDGNVLPWVGAAERSFYEYSGDVYILIDSDYLDQSETAMMLEGTYRSRVYMHVVTKG